MNKELINKKCSSQHCHNREKQKKSKRKKKTRILPTEVLGRCGQSICYDIKRHSHSILKWKEHSISSFHVKLYIGRYNKCTNQYSYIRVMGLWVLLFSVYFLKRFDFNNSNFLRSEFIFIHLEWKWIPSRLGKVLCRMLLKRYNPDTFPTNFKDMCRSLTVWGLPTHPCNIFQYNLRKAERAGDHLAS